MNIKILFSACLIAVVLSAEFNITSTSTCMEANAQGFCTKWQQSGRVVEDLGSCFPAEALVMTPEGLIRMDQLNSGSKILGFANGEQVFTEVVSWFHHEPTIQGEFLEINVGADSLKVSAKHNVAVEGMNYVFAEDLKGQTLHGAGSVDSIKKVESLGLYSPRTTSNNYYVYLTPQTKVLAHCFAHIRDPQFYEFAVSTIESTWNLFSQEAKESKIHPSYEWMRKAFSFLQE